MSTPMTVRRLMTLRRARLAVNTNLPHPQLMIKARCLQPTRRHALNSACIMCTFSKMRGGGVAKLTQIHFERPLVDCIYVHRNLAQWPKTYNWLVRFCAGNQQCLESAVNNCLLILLIFRPFLPHS